MNRKVFGLALSFSLALSAFTMYTSDSVHAADSLSSIKKKQQANQQKAKDAKSELSKNQESQSSVKAEITKLDHTVADTDQKVTAKENEISSTKESINQLKVEIEAVQKRIDKRDKILKERVNSMYESGGAVQYLEVILGSKDFGDFLDRVLALNVIAEQDRQLLEEQKKDKELLEEKMAAVEKKLAELERARDELQALQKQLEAQLAEKARLMASLKEEEKSIHTEMHKIENEGQILASQEAAFRAEQERQRKAAAAAAAAKNSAPSAYSSAPAGNGMINKPTSAPVTSGFGYRSFDHDMHYGVDMAAGGTVPIHAAADGTVIRAEYSSSYGNVVYLSHYINGQQWTTVYAHMRSLGVSSGQQVSRGQFLGNMGETGDAYGQHLHFELYKGPWTASHSNAVNPAAYW